MELTGGLPEEEFVCWSDGELIFTGGSDKQLSHFRNGMVTKSELAMDVPKAEFLFLTIPPPIFTQLEWCAGCWNKNLDLVLT